jgi:hypothetical protein
MSDCDGHREHYHDRTRRKRPLESHERAERKALHRPGSVRLGSARRLRPDRLRSRRVRAEHRRHPRVILSEADALMRLRLKEKGFELPHLVVARLRKIRSLYEAMATRRSCAPSVKT